MARTSSPSPATPASPPAIAYYLCPAGCGCRWRDNGDGTMSLFDASQVSCVDCERLPLDRLWPVTVERAFAIDREPQRSARIQRHLEEASRLMGAPVVVHREVTVVEIDATPRLYAYLEQLVDHEGYGETVEEVALRLAWDSIHHLLGRGVLRGVPRSRPQAPQGGPP